MILFTRYVLPDFVSVYELYVRD